MYSRAPFSGADQKARGLCERDWPWDNRCALPGIKFRNTYARACFELTLICLVLATGGGGTFIYGQNSYVPRGRVSILK